MRKLLLVLCAFFACLLIKAEELPKLLSPDAEISLLTCSPGEELYSLFGHSAIRVRDTRSGFDAVYNYGTFAFNDDFYFNFIMGQLNYRLSVQSFDRFMAEYVHYERGVIEQVLNLDSAQTKAVYDYLNWNYLPENRYYAYDFFYNNCSSKLGVVLEETLGESLQWKDLKEESNPTFRNIIDRYLIYHPWGDFGIDLGLGLPCDKVPNSKEYMFLPDKLLEAYDHATVNQQPLVARKHRLLPAKGLQYKWSLTDPVPLFWLLFGFIGILSAIGWRKKRIFKGLDVFLFICIGALGLLIFFLWFITDHTDTANNFNMLWAWPTHIFAIPLLFWERTRRFYWWAYGLVLLVTLVTFPLLPQMLHLATIPIMLTMLVRAVANISISPHESMRV